MPIRIKGPGGHAMQAVADTGLLKALLDRNDPLHRWAARVFPENAPWLTCEPVLTEAAHLTRAPEKIMQLVARGDLLVQFDAAAEADRLIELLMKYKDRPMDLADACLVRMAELEREAVIYTVDREDFKIYRKNGRQPLPCVFPSDE